MRLPSETYQIQQTIETHLPHLSQPQLAGLALWVCGAILAGSACQNAVASALSPWRKWNNLRQYLPGVALRRQRPRPPLQNPAGRNPLLRAPAPLGAYLVAFRPAGPGHRPHPQGRSDHRHRHQRPLPGLRHSRGLEHPPRHPARLLDGSHRGTAQGTGPSRSPGNDRDCPLRPGHIQSQAVEADMRPGLAPLYALSEEHHFLRRWWAPVARSALRFPS